MKQVKHLSKTSLVFLVLLFGTSSFITALFSMAAYQSESYQAKKLEEGIKDAKRLMFLDKSISFERSLRLFTTKQSFVLFDEQCNPVHATDMLITHKSCKKTSPRFSWTWFKSPSGERYKIGFINRFKILEYLKDNISIITTTIILYAFFIFIVTIALMKLFIEMPSRKISESVLNVLKNKEYTPLVAPGALFNDLYQSIQRLVEQVVQFKRHEEKLILSQQIAHDLRAPIAVLEEQFNSNHGAVSIEKLALDKLKEIANGLLPINNTQIIKQHPETNISKLLNDLCRLYPQISIEFKITKELESPQTLLISETELFRYLSNLFKNSMEASAKKIFISAELNERYLIVDVLDNGVGTKKELLDRIIKGYTSKVEGNGLGLSSIYRNLKRLHGDLVLQIPPDGGFNAILRIPLKSKRDTTHVLIDDDKIIRIGWSNKASRKGIQLQCFESIMQFLENREKVPTDAFIYIDSNLKNGVKGEIASKEIADMGYFNIFLSTGYPSDSFNLSEFPWIKGVLPKSSPF